MLWFKHILFTCGVLAAGMATVCGQNVGFDNITIDDGLMHNHVNNIVQDSEGFMWFGTRDGLCRYDGYEFTLYPVRDSVGLVLTDQRIQQLFVDHDGNIWVMPTIGGLYIFDPLQLRFSPKKVSLPLSWWDNAIIQSAMRDSRGNYWIGTTDNGVLELDSALTLKLTFSTAASESDRRITGEYCYSFTEDKYGRIWMGVSGLYVNRYDPSSDSLHVIINEDLTEDESYSYRRSLTSLGDTLWVGTEGKGIWAYDLKQEVFLFEVLPDVYVRDLAKTPQGHLLVATDGHGLFRSVAGTGNFENFTFDPNQVKSLSTNALYDIYIDQNENIWLGSYNGGVNLLPRQQARFATYRLPSISEQSTGSNSVLAFAGNDPEALWVGLDGGGIWKLSIHDESLTSIHTLYPDLELSSEVITALYLDKENTLWAGTFLNGLNRIDLQTGTAKIYRTGPDTDGAGLQNNNIWDITEDADGRIWLATLGGGLHVFDRATESFSQYLPQSFGSSLSGRNVRALYLDKEQNLWIGTERGGLNKLLPDRKTFISWTQNQTTGQPLRSNSVIAINEDDLGRIWIGTEGGGLHRLLPDESGFEHYDVVDGMPSNIVYSIEPGESGSLWIGTSRGLVLLDTKSDRIIEFDQRDGLLSNQFNPNASVSVADGTLLFGNLKGVNAINPDLIKIEGSYPQVVFTDFSIFNKSVSMDHFGGTGVIDDGLNSGTTINLSYDDDAFTISFAALAFNAQEKIQYAYRLIGFNESWIYVDADDRSATYTNLDAGDYTFEVKASNVFGEWPDAMRKLEIIVHPPFWKAWWFTALIALVLATLVFLILRFADIRRREEQQRKLEQAQQEILRLKNEQLEREIKAKNSKLSAALLQSAHKNKALASLGEQLKEISKDEAKRTEKEQDLRKLVRKISSEVDSVDYWEQFQLNFDAIHMDFSHKLYDRHPNLTQNDLRLCSLIRVNMSNSEIGAIQNVSKSGVEKSKYRLKQKLGLRAEDDLHAYIQAIK